MKQNAASWSSPPIEVVNTIRLGLHKATVLVVEDDEEMRTFLDESLRDEGYRVRTASSTLSGIIALMADGADVVIVDWRMPDIDGFGLLAAVRRSFVKVPVIFVTGFPRSDVRARAYEEGACAFLAKPFRMNVLLREIERALDRSRGRSQDRAPDGPAEAEDAPPPDRSA